MHVHLNLTVKMEHYVPPKRLETELHCLEIQKEDRLVF